MYKKPRKLNDGTVVHDTYAEMRNPNRSHCDKYPQSAVGIRSDWVLKLANAVAGKFSSYVVETTCAERTDRQREIARTLLVRFNELLELNASLESPKTTTDKTLATVADRLSLWLDKNVKMSEEAVERLRKREARKAKEEETKKEESKPPGEDKLPGEPTPSEVPPEGGEKGDAGEDEKLQPPPTEEPPKELETGGKEGEVPSPEEPETVPKEEPKATDEGAEPAEEEAKPAEDETKPAEEEAKPAEEKEIPAEEEAKPAEEETKPAEEEAKPAEEETKPAEEEAKPAEEEAKPAEDEAKPAEEKAASTEQEPQPADSESTPPEEDAVPLQQEPTPSEGEPAPTDEEPQTEADEAPTTEEPLSELDESTELPEDETPTERMLEEEPEESEPETEPPTTEAEEEPPEPKKEHQEPEKSKSDDLLKSVASLIDETEEAPSPRQEVVKDMLEKKMEKLLGDEDPDAIRQVAGKVSSWMDQIVDQAEKEYGVRDRAGARPPVSQKPKGAVFRLSRTPDAGFKVERISHTAAADTSRRSRGLPEQRPPNKGQPLSPQEAKKWAKWAGEVSKTAADWAGWIGNTVQEAQTNNDTAWKDKKSDDARQWRRTKKQIDQQAAAWLEKTRN